MLNCDEFVTLAVHLKRLSSDEHLLQAFHQFDKNGNGYIEFEELRDSLSDEHLGPNNDQFVQDIILDADLDKVRMCSYSTFAIFFFFVYLRSIGEIVVSHQLFLHRTLS